jgi:hypothetical protein
MDCFLLLPDKNVTGFLSKKNIFFLCTALTLITGVIYASSLRFVNDDAFISFRYAKNLVNGLGLVYNPGERVEGFTNFLWTIIIAGGMKVGFDPISFSMALGIFFFCLTIGLYSMVTWKLREDAISFPLVLPVTSLLLAVHRDFNVYATSGLETMIFTFLVSSCIACLVLYRHRVSHLMAGALIVLAMMARPDGIVFLGAVCFYLLLAKTPLKTIALFLLPTVVVFIPYWFWRYQYFGFFFPNAFYAKSIALPYYEQGWKYIAMYFKTYYVFFVIPCTAFMLALKYFSSTKDKPLSVSWLQNELETNPTIRGIALAVLCTGMYIVFVFRIGGDFMFARFLIPVTPMLCFLVEQCMYSLSKRSWRFILTGIVIAVTVFRWDQFREGPRVEYIADEWKWYTPQHLEESKIHGEVLNRYFHGLPVKAAFWAGQVKMIYYADPYIAIESSAGLTDTTIAHQPIIERGRPGHEKQASEEYLVRRGTNFFFGPLTPPPPGQQVLNIILFDSIAAKIIVYENAVMDSLAKKPGVRFYSFPKYLDAYIDRINSLSTNEVSRDYPRFKSFYFDHNNDPVRENVFIRRLGG